MFGLFIVFKNPPVNCHSTLIWQYLSGVVSAISETPHKIQIAECGARIVKSAMPLNVLIVTDKFKGTLNAQAAAELIALGWREARPQDRLELLPMSDGGDGFG